MSAPVLPRAAREALAERQHSSLLSQPARKKRKVSEKQLEVLKRHAYKPGQTGNAGGAGAGQVSIKALLLRVMDQESDRKSLEGKTLTWAEALALGLARMACDGHPVAMKEVLERIDGKVKQEIDIHVEHELWGKLNAGRLRIASQRREIAESASVQYDDAIEIERHAEPSPPRELDQASALAKI